MSAKTVFEITDAEACQLTEAGCCITSAGPIIINSSKLIRAYVLALRELEAKRPDKIETPEERA